jgi:uncharacterized SAM-binding protein YcdF (DUF218 family)
MRSLLIVLFLLLLCSTSAIVWPNMRFIQFLATGLLAGFSALTVAAPFTGKPGMMIKPYERDSEPLQDIVTWDQHSIFVRGERVLFYSGEYHPFRLPVPGLWLDVGLTDPKYEHFAFLQ